MLNLHSLCNIITEPGGAWQLNTEVNENGTMGRRIRGIS